MLFGGPLGVALLGASPNGGTPSGSFFPALIGSFVFVGVVAAVLLKITGPRGFTRPKASLMVSEIEPGSPRKHAWLVQGLPSARWLRSDDFHRHVAHLDRSPGGAPKARGDTPSLRPVSRRWLQSLTHRRADQQIALDLETHPV